MSEAYGKHCHIPKMKGFVKIVNGFSAVIKMFGRVLITPLNVLVFEAGTESSFFFLCDKKRNTPNLICKNPEATDSIANRNV